MQPRGLKYKSKEVTLRLKRTWGDNAIGVFHYEKLVDVAVPVVLAIKRRQCNELRIESRVETRRKSGRDDQSRLLEGESTVAWLPISTGPIVINFSASSSLCTSTVATRGPLTYSGGRRWLQFTRPTVNGLFTVFFFQCSSKLRFHEGKM